MHFYIICLAVQGYIKVPGSYAQWFCPLDLAIVFKDNYEDFWFTNKTGQYAKLANFYIKQSDEILKFIKQYSADVLEARQEILKHSSRINEFSKSQIKEGISKIFLMIQTNFSGISIARRLDIFLLPKLRQGLAKSINKPLSEIDSLLAKVVRSPYLSYQAEAKNIFYKRLNRLGKVNQANLNKFFDDYLKEYDWVNMSYFDEPPLSKADLFKRIKEKPQFVKGEKFHIPKVIPPRCKNLIKVLSYSAYLKDFLRGKNAELVWLLEPYFIEIGRRFNLSVSTLKAYSPDEIFRLIRYLKKVPLNILKARQNLTVFFKGKRLEGKAARKIVRQYNLVSAPDKKQNIFSGRAACPGRAEGKAVVAWNVDDLKRIKIKNLILVISNTNPAFVPYLKKINGMVAEEGGITTHVSLIAREFKIPTVVGVFNATKIIKTGDLVEVDADKGIVKILKKVK